MDRHLEGLHGVYPGLFQGQDTPDFVTEHSILEFDIADDPWDLPPQDVLSPDWDASSDPAPVSGGGRATTPFDPAEEVGWGALGGRSWPTEGPLPPPDVLGFYLPFHMYYRPGSMEQVWGIYLIGSAIRSFGGWLYQQARGRIPMKACCQAAQGLVYHHEFFHHRAEGLATRLEVAAQGRPMYTTWIKSKFMTGLAQLPPSVREEALAEAHALREARRVVREIEPALNDWQRRRLVAALEDYTALTGPPYTDGLKLVRPDEFQEELSVLSSDYAQKGPYDPRTRAHRAWQAANHMTRGIKTVESRSFWYVWDLPGLPVAGSVPRPWQRIKARDLIGYARSKGFSADHQTGSHLIMKRPSGEHVSIPVHSGRDLKTGLLMKLLKQLGGSWDDYLAFARG